MTVSRSIPVLAAAGAALWVVPAQAQVGRAPSFTKDVLPIFARSCQNCHLGADAKGGLKLDSLDNLRLGGSKGDIIVPGNPDQSRLVKYIDGRLMPRMPLNGRPLPPAAIAAIRSWIQAGAKDDGAVSDQGAEKPLTISAPKDGSEVREKVQVVVPRTTIPPNGFVAVYIDGKFRVALAPPSVEDVTDKKLPADAPVTYVWDTKAPFTDDQTAANDDRLVQDGPHVIEIKSYKESGAQAETAAVQVNVKNGIDYPSNYPAKLWYSGRVGKAFIVQNRVELEANAATGGRHAVAAGPDKLSHNEDSKILVSLEDLSPATGSGFWRERRENPLVVTVNGLKNTVRSDVSSRYYTLERTGAVKRSRQMERENREPIINPLDLPGRPQRMNETFTTNLRVYLGAYIPGTIDVDRLQATLEGVEWQKGERCVRIRLDYIAGKSTLDIKSLGLTGVEFDISQGSSTIWFSEETNRVLMAKHDIKGTMKVDSSQLGGSGGPSGSGGLGGEGAPGGDVGLGGGSSGGSSGGPFVAGGGNPYAGRGGFRPPSYGPGGSGYGNPGNPYGGGAPGPSGLGSGSGPAAAGLGGSGGIGGGSPTFGGPGSPGFGGSPFGGAGGGAPAGDPPAKKQYFAKLKIVTEIVDDNPTK